MFCGQCGKQIVEGAKFCPYCGEQFAEAEESTVEWMPKRIDPVNDRRAASATERPTVYCKRCGAIIDEKAVICPKCGVAQDSIRSNSADDTGSIGWGILGFCIPLVGLILYLVWKTDKPRNAGMAGKGALVAVIIEVVIYVIAAALGVSLFASFL